MSMKPNTSGVYPQGSKKSLIEEGVNVYEDGIFYFNPNKGEMTMCDGTEWVSYVNSKNADQYLSSGGASTSTGTATREKLRAFTVWWDNNATKTISNFNKNHRYQGTMET